MDYNRKPQNGDLVCYKGENMVVIYNKDVWWFSNELKDYYLIKEDEIGKLNKEIQIDEILKQCLHERWEDSDTRRYNPFQVIEENKYEIDIKTITTVNIKQTKKDAIN